MATLKTIRKRITSVRNTQKITKAMKMVAAAKLRRAQSALVQARPHSQFLRGTVARLVRELEIENHPLLTPKTELRKAHIIILTSDRGLCGGFNGNLLRKVDLFLRHEGKQFQEVELSVVGRKGRDYYRAKRIATKEEIPFKLEGFTFHQAEAMARDWAKCFLEGEFDVLYLGYNSFKSAISQEPTLQQMLPLQIEVSDETTPSPLICEGDASQLLESLLSRYLATLLFLAILESNASEVGARMSAMENATNNAREMIFNLTLQYNRARQASITTELMDIVNGAEALK